MNTITIEELLNEKEKGNNDLVIVDTRSPKEYELDHIFGAINIPLFSNDERAVVGTLYTKSGRLSAIKEGIQIFSKKLPLIMEEFFKYRNKKIIIYCWRGGMRSKIMNNFLDSLGFYTRQLVKGYKAYRLYLNNYFEKIDFKPKLVVLYGLTGTGKTDILRHTNLPKIDLEGLAQHRNSLLGAINLKPNTQKMFDSLLFEEINKLKDEKYILIEGESRKIGNVQIPIFLWKKMKSGINIKVNANMQRRVDVIYDEYFNPISEKDINHILRVLEFLRPKLSHKLVDELILMINNKEYRKFTQIMLESYYDPLYNYTLDQVKYDFEVDNQNLDKSMEEIANFLNYFKY